MSRVIGVFLLLLFSFLVLGSAYAQEPVVPTPMSPYSGVGDEWVGHLSNQAYQDAQYDYVDLGLAAAVATRQAADSAVLAALSAILESTPTVTPTPTPTLPVSSIITASLPSGNQVALRYEVSLGELALVLVAVVLSLVGVFALVFNAMRGYRL